MQSYYENDWRNLVDPIEAAEEALEIIKQRKAVAFIGSGISRGYYPSWGESVVELCKACGIDPPGSIDIENPEKLIKKAEECKRQNEETYYHKLKELFGTEFNGIRNTYILLLRLPFKAYITTNFDPMLATTWTYLTKKNKFYAYPNLPYRELSNGQVFYIHGYIHGYIKESCTQIKVVFAKSEFEEAYNKEQSLLPAFLQQLFTYERVIFVGCRLGEPQLYRILEIIKNIKSQHFNQHHLQHYILLPEGEGNKEHYEKMGIKVIYYKKINKKHIGLDKILEGWCDLRPPIPFSSLEEIL